jgi:hypothetical protein
MKKNTLSMLENIKKKISKLEEPRVAAAKNQEQKPESTEAFDDDFEDDFESIEENSGKIHDEDQKHDVFLENEIENSFGDFSDLEEDVFDNKLEEKGFEKQENIPQAQESQENTPDSLDDDFNFSESFEDKEEKVEEAFELEEDNEQTQEDLELPELENSDFDEIEESPKAIQEHHSEFEKNSAIDLEEGVDDEIPQENHENHEEIHEKEEKIDDSQNDEEDIFAKSNDDIDELGFKQEDHEINEEDHLFAEKSDDLAAKDDIFETKNDVFEDLKEPRIDDLKQDEASKEPQNDDDLLNELNEAQSSLEDSSAEKNSSSEELNHHDNHDFDIDLDSLDKGQDATSEAKEEDLFAQEDSSKIEEEVVFDTENSSSNLINQDLAQKLSQSVKSIQEAKYAKKNLAGISQIDINSLALKALEPRLAQWFDENLEQIVEKIVREEIQKIIN